MFDSGQGIVVEIDDGDESTGRNAVLGKRDEKKPNARGKGELIRCCRCFDFETGDE